MIARVRSMQTHRLSQPPARHVARAWPRTIVVLVLPHPLAVKRRQQQPRWRRCSGPVSVITELGPMIGAIGEMPAAEGATSGGAVKTVLTASGSLTTTIRRPLGANVSVNASPSRSAQRSSTHGIASAHASVCTTAGIRGPGGSDVAAAGAPRCREGAGVARRHP